MKVTAILFSSILVLFFVLGVEAEARRAGEERSGESSSSAEAPSTKTAPAPLDTSRTNDEPSDPIEVSLLGKITKLPASAPKPKTDSKPSDTEESDEETVDLRFELKSKKKYVVEADTNTQVQVFESIKMKDAPASSKVWILGARQASTRTEDDRTFPAQIIKINAVVIAESADLFRPPPVSEELRKQRVSWGFGTLDNYETRFSYRGTDGSINMQIGPERRIVRVRTGSLEECKKRDMVSVGGELDPTTKPKTIQATRIVRLAPKIPFVELERILGPQKTPPRKR